MFNSKSGLRNRSNIGAATDGYTLRHVSRRLNRAEADEISTIVRRSMKAIAVIPARLASTRLPRKMLREIAGKPLIGVRVRGGAFFAAARGGHRRHRL